MSRIGPIFVLLFAFSAPAVRAEIALFTNGRSIHIESWRVDGAAMRLELRGGGSLMIPLERVERIVDDEIASPAELAADASIERSWRYDETNMLMWGTPYDHIIHAAGRRFDVDAALIAAVIRTESDFRGNVVSHKGAQGLMQLMPATAARFGVTNSFDPVANIHAGTRYLKWLLEKFDGDIELALAGYNAGEGNVMKYNGIPPFRETIQYVRKIRRILGES